jgi:HemY protein
MRKALLLLAALVGVAAITLWLLRLGGTVEIRAGEFWIGLPVPVAAGLLALGFILLHGAFRLWAWSRGVPGRMGLRRAARLRADGDAAITRALIALGAGTAPRALEETRRARALLGDTPQTL